MIQVTGQVSGLQETSSALQMLPSLLQQAAQAAMTQSLQLLSTTVREKYLMGPYPEQIERRTGSFRATFARGHPLNIWQVRAQGTQVLGTFGSSDRRARILNDGGVIRPVRSQYLAVRTEFTKDSRGAVRAKYQQPLRQLHNTFVRPIRAPSAVAAVFERIGRRVVPIAWLVRFVLIRGRKFMESTQRDATPGIQMIFQQRMDVLITRMNDTLARIRGRR